MIRSTILQLYPHSLSYHDKIFASFPFSPLTFVLSPSTIADVTIGPAKVLYKRFKRLGIYSWNNVVEKSHNDPEGDVMAVRFTNTELFEAIIPRKQLDTVLRKYMGTNPPLSTAVKIPNDCFCELYRMGSADKKEDGKKL